MAYDEERQAHLDYKYKDDPRVEPKNKSWCADCKTWVWDSDFNGTKEICFSCESAAAQEFSESEADNADSKN